MPPVRSNVCSVCLSGPLWTVLRVQSVVLAGLFSRSGSATVSSEGCFTVWQATVLVGTHLTLLLLVECGFQPNRHYGALERLRPMA